MYNTALATLPNMAYQNATNEELYGKELKSKDVALFARSILSYRSTYNSMIRTSVDLFKMDFNTLEANIIKLHALSQLEENWDGYGAHVISEDIILFTRTLLNYLNSQPNVFPTKRGTINLEYDLADDLYLEFEVYKDKIVSYLDRKNDKSVIEYFLTDYNNPYNISIDLNSRIADLYR